MEQLLATGASIDRRRRRHLRTASTMTAHHVRSMQPESQAMCHEHRDPDRHGRMTASSTVSSSTRMSIAVCIPVVVELVDDAMRLCSRRQLSGDRCLFAGAGGEHDVLRRTFADVPGSRIA